MILKKDKMKICIWWILNVVSVVVTTTVFGFIFLLNLLLLCVLRQFLQILTDPKYCFSLNYSILCFGNKKYLLFRFVLFVCHKEHITSYENKLSFVMPYLRGICFWSVWFYICWGKNPCSSVFMLFHFLISSFGLG